MKTRIRPEYIRMAFKQWKKEHPQYKSVFQAYKNNDIESETAWLQILTDYREKYNIQRTGEKHDD